MNDKLPPSNRDAEASLLGACLRDNANILDAAQVLQIEDFYLFGHQCIFSAMIDLHLQRGQPVNAVVLADELNSNGKMADVGGYGYLVDLWNNAPCTSVAPYLRIVRRDSIRRDLIHAGLSIVGQAQDAADAETALEHAQKAVFAIADRGQGSRVVPFSEVLTEATERIDRRGLSSEAAGISTGFPDLDKITGGNHPAELTVLAARPSVGKTAFALNVSYHAANAGIPVLFASIEQSRAELGERTISLDTGIDAYRLRTGRLTSDDRPRIAAARQRLASLPLFIDDAPVQSMLNIAAATRRMKLRHGIRLVVIDYLQLIEPEDRKAPRHEQVATVSRRLKALAKEINVPVLALAQLNRASESRSDGRPRLSDLRESGQIEQDADNVLFLHREAKEPPPPVDDIEVIVAKQRNGPVGSAVLRFDKRIVRLHNAAF